MNVLILSAALLGWPTVPANVVYSATWMGPTPTSVPSYEWPMPGGWWGFPCPACFASGATSSVEIGTTTSTLLYGGNGWDAEGRPLPDPNTHTTHFRCSRGHQYHIASQGGKRRLFVVGIPAPEEHEP